MVELTMLAEMMSPDLDVAARDLAELGVTTLDLKSRIYGATIENLVDERRQRLAALLERTGQTVTCFSSGLGYWNIDERGERAFRTEMERGIANMAATARLVRPARARLLSCTFTGREASGDPLAHLDKHAPWVFAAYRDAIDQIEAAGLVATIENEVHTMLSGPAETVGFFARLERPAARFTWDIQNMWQSGAFPTLAGYRQLQPLIDYVHLKGGRTADGAVGPLAFRSTLDVASWPVRDIVRAVIDDGVSPVLCLNPSHGALSADREPPSPEERARLTRDEAIANVRFLRAQFKEIR